MCAFLKEKIVANSEILKAATYYVLKLLKIALDTIEDNLDTMQ